MNKDNAMFPSQRPEIIRGLLEHKPKLRNHFGPPPSPPIPIGMSASQMSLVHPIQTAANISRFRQSSRSRAISRHGVSVTTISRSRLTSAMSNTGVHDEIKTPSDESPKMKLTDTLSIIYKNMGNTDKDEAHLRAIPSAWSNQRTNINYRHPFGKFLQVVDKSANDSQICLTCQELNKSPMLASKTDAERAVFVKLCEEALTNRKAAQDYYATIYRDDKVKDRAHLSNFSQNKALLGDFMLKLALKRQASLRTRKPNQRIVVLKHEEAAMYLSDHLSPSEMKSGSKMLERPVYCLRGWTTVGKPTEGMYFPNSFADLASLRNPSDDPPGYRRYCAFVHMKEFKPNEIFMRVRGNCLTFDGLKLKLKRGKENRLTGTRIVSEEVELPKGVSPGRLRIGRSSDGVLVIQEPWHFSNF